MLEEGIFWKKASSLAKKAETLYGRIFMPTLPSPKSSPYDLVFHIKGASAFLYLSSAFLGLFPFFYLTAHPTLWCLGGVLVLDVWCFCICRGRGLCTSFSERAALAFACLCLAGGVFSRGRLADGVAAAVAVTVIFPMCRAARMGREYLFFGIQIGGLLISLYGIWQYFFGGLTLQWTDTQHFSDISSRVSATFGNPNILAIYLLLLFPGSLWYFLRTNAKRRFFALSCAVAELLCLIFTWSRGAWLGALLEMGLVLLFATRNTRILLILAPLWMSPLLLFLPQSICRRFSSILTFRDTSVHYRFYTWKGVLEMIRAHPLGIGVGENAFLAVYPAYAVSGTERVMHAHNVFLQVTVELGWSGLLLFLLLLGALFLSSLKGEAEGSSTIAVLGACVMGMFDHLWYACGMLAFLFAVIGIAIGGGAHEQA